MNDTTLIIPTQDNFNDIAITSSSEERLVTDVRASMTPADMIEKKLVMLLKNGALPVSHVLASRRGGWAR